MKIVFLDTQKYGEQIYQKKFAGSHLSFYEDFGYFCAR